VGWLCRSWGRASPVLPSCPGWGSLWRVGQTPPDPPIPSAQPRNMNDNMMTWMKTMGINIGKLSVRQNVRERVRVREREGQKERGWWLALKYQYMDSVIEYVKYNNVQS